ncbi:unnamed protein product [Gongylonema pulchrum]|uniref:14_3_3 domain-containing protein n=1 Tax=Gongylonema pulchrum TaxID=637853 RepID=A0A183DFJ8_9BILA|nr:unnamed protein product [Gongylonema pulchrum]
MACTLQSLRIGRRFDAIGPVEETPIDATLFNVQELKATAELMCPKKSALLAYRLYKCRDKLVSFIDGSKGQYRVRCLFGQIFCHLDILTIFRFLDEFLVVNVCVCMCTLSLRLCVAVCIDM